VGKGIAIDRENAVALFATNILLQQGLVQNPNIAVTNVHRKPFCKSEELTISVSNAENHLFQSAGMPNIAHSLVMVRHWLKINMSARNTKRLVQSVEKTSKPSTDLRCVALPIVVEIKAMKS
jgi:hypothetical protein